MKQSKNYIGWVNDHSGSMDHLAAAAMVDYNANIKAVKEAASREMLDTVVSVVGIGLGNNGRGCERQVVVSNPHVLQEVKDWPTPGGTPLYDGIGNMIELFDSLPDIKDPHVSVLIMVTTDGEEGHSSNYTQHTLAALIKERQATGRWTFVLRVPKDQVNRREISNLGIPKDNIQGWDTTSAGMAASTVASTKAMDGYFAARSAGKKASSSFYADASNVNLAVLKEINQSEIQMYVVEPEFNGKWISDYILSKRQQYLKGAAFFQLTKTEPKVGQDKIILIREPVTGKFYGGDEARKMLGIPTFGNVRLHPGMLGEYAIFVQSKSWNRHLVAGTGVAYWQKQGVAFTQEDVDKVTKPAEPKRAGTPPPPEVVKLPTVPPTNKPTKSPLVPTKRRTFGATRDDARIIAKQQGKKFRDNGSGSPKGERWEVV